MKVDLLDINRIMQCRFCDYKHEKPNCLAWHQKTCKKNPNRTQGKNQYSYGASCSEETKEILRKKNIGRTFSSYSKKKISESMKKAHSEGRAHNIGTCRWNNEKSWPEEFFSLVIDNEFKDKNYKYEYPLGVYSIDFAWPYKMKAIEIDGKQHEMPDYKERDTRKDKYLFDNGWDVLRIKWVDMYHDSTKWINIAKRFIEGL